MPSGKQLAFNKGEVSPAFRYKASSVAYSEGLHKLRNGFTRQGGGVSNRSGFRHIENLRDVGVTPKNIKSNTKLFFQKRKEYLGNVTNKKHSGDIYFVRPTNDIAGQETTDIFEIKLFNTFSNFSKDTNSYIFNYENTDVQTMQFTPMDRDIFFVSRNAGIIRLPYGDIFEPKAGKSASLIFNLTADGEVPRVEVVSDYFYRNAGRDFFPSLSVEMMGSSVNSGIRAVYFITETPYAGEERIICAYDGTFNSFQGAGVTFTLMENFQPLDVSGDAAKQNSQTTIGNFLDRYRQRGVMFLDFNGSPRISCRNNGTLQNQADLSSRRVRVFTSDGLIGTDQFTMYTLSYQEFRFESALPPSRDALHIARPASGRFEYKLYRSFGLGEASSLVSSQLVDYEELNKLAGRASLITLRDLSNNSGVASRGLRDSFRLYGGTGSDLIDNRFYRYNQEDYGVHSGHHYFYRPSIAENNIRTTRFVPFVRIRELMQYQQRTFVSYIDEGPSDERNTLRSVIGVSAINSKFDFATAPVVNPANAFEFNIPLGDVSPVVAMLGADRPLIFTLSNVYMLLGTDAGIITPTEINPTVIYTGGCSETVRPVLVDNQAFFLNNDHTSLVMIAFNASGGRGVQVIETDEYAKHFLEMNITQIAVVKSFETVIWLLTTEGKLVSMTMYEGGQSFGFGLHELSDGFVENITAARYPYMYHETTRNNAWATPDVEVLAATIVRDGARTLEVMTGRDDRLSENMGFLDGQVTFGTRLTMREDGFNYDLERPFDRFNNTYNPPMASEMANDMDAIFTAFGTVLKETVASITDNSWVRYTWGSNAVSELQGSKFYDMEYFDDGADTVNRRPYSRGGLYERRDQQQTLNVLKKDAEGFYTVEFKADHSLYSFIPKIIAEGGFTANSALEQQVILIYLDIMSVFVGHTAYTNLNDRQKALVRNMILRGYVWNFKSPEYIQYFTGERYITLKKVSTEDDVVTQPLESTNVNLRRIGTPVSGNPNADYRVPANIVSNNLRDRSVYSAARFFNVTVTIPSRGKTLSREFLVKAKYAPVGNEEIPEAYLDVENNPSIPSEEKFRITTNWATMTNEVTGLTHLANKKVAVFADNEVVSSPLSEKPTVSEKALTVDNAGMLKLPNHYQWGVVGIPYRFEMETLQIEAQEANRALISGRKVINRLNVALHRTREGVRTSAIKGFEYDPEVDASYPLYNESIREKSIDKKNGTFSGVVEPSLAAGWSEGGRVRITHSDPTPVTINAVYPKGIESGD